MSSGGTRWRGIAWVADGDEAAGTRACGSGIPGESTRSVRSPCSASSKANFALTLSGARSSAVSRASWFAGSGMISGRLRQEATVRTPTPRNSANDSLVMCRDCRSRSASRLVHDTTTGTPAALSAVADTINHRGDVGHVRAVRKLTLTPAQLADTIADSPGNRSPVTRIAFRHAFLRAPLPAPRLAGPRTEPRPSASRRRHSVTSGAEISSRPNPPITATSALVSAPGHDTPSRTHPADAAHGPSSAPAPDRNSHAQPPA